MFTELAMLRDLLMEHMDAEDALPAYRLQRALLANEYGQLITIDDVIGGATAAGLLLVMRDGRELHLTLAPSSSERQKSITAAFAQKQGSATTEDEEAERAAFTA